MYKQPGIQGKHMFMQAGKDIQIGRKTDIQAGNHIDRQFLDGQIYRQAVIVRQADIVHNE